VLAWSPYPGTYLQSLEPQHPAYAAMKKALASLRATVGDVTNFVTIDTGARVKLGDSDDRLVDIRDRLASLGHGVAATGDPAVLDEDLAAALKAFQAEKGVKPTGNLDDATVAALNGQGGELNIHRLVDNMERLRWLPKDLGYRHVFVNQAAFEVRVMEGSNEIWKSKVIVGKPTTQTEVFDDQIEMVVFNPSWGVPPSIIANEYLPKLRVDPSYLDRIGFKVSTVNGDTVSSSDIDWNSYGSKVPFNVEQPPGSGNALGELKFLFPNAHNIYMHDTPQRELFSRSERAFSHGCVRVQNPREFATILLGWNRAKVDSNTDSRRSQTVRLPKPVPIHLAYFTAWPAADGSITYYRDIYGRDETLEKAMSATILAQR
jgi:murein L,D-transpeptidase YcbB/YkuD